MVGAAVSPIAASNSNALRRTETFVDASSPARLVIHALFCDTDSLSLPHRLASSCIAAVVVAWLLLRVSSISHHTGFDCASGARIVSYPSAPSHAAHGSTIASPATINDASLWRFPV